MNAIQNYAKDELLLLMIEDGKLTTKSRKELCGLRGAWIWLQATVMGRGPLSFKSVCKYIHAHPDLFSIQSGDDILAWNKFKNKVQDYNSQRFFSWKKAAIPPLTVEYLPESVDNRDIDKVIAEVQKLSKLLPQLGKKLALIIGRTTDEPIPSEKDTVWVALDTDLGQNLDPSRIHLTMDYNERIADRLKHLFDKIVLDPCTLGGKYPWTRLNTLLRPSPESVLISHASMPYSPITFDQKVAEEQPGAFRGEVTAYWKDNKLQDSDRYHAIAHAKAKLYLQTLFEKVTYVQNEDYPYYKTPLKSTYFYMQGPKEVITFTPNKLNIKKKS